MKTRTTRMTSWSKFDRRALLRGTAAGMLLAPFVPVLSSPARAAERRKRLLMWFTGNGLEQKTWLPTGTETAFTLNKILDPVKAYQSKLLVLAGIDLLSWKAQTPGVGNDHPPVLGHVLTANDVIDPMDGTKSANSNTWYAGHESIDQFIARKLPVKTKFPSLVLGVKAGGHLARLSYRGPRDAVPPNSDPMKTFESLFGDLIEDPAARTRMRVEQKSVIDRVLGDLKSLETRVSSSDKHKIASHVERLRALELRLLADAGAVCGKPDLAKLTDPSEFVTHGKRQMENIVTALACDLTRVANFIWSVASTNQSFPWVGITEGHHNLAHAKQNQETKDKLAAVGNFYGTMFAHLLTRMSEYQEDGATLLDNTAVVWYSEHAATSGGHQRTNLPFLIAGSCGGAFKTGRYINYSGVAHNDLFVSLAQAMGLSDVTTFGRADVCKGPLPGLT